MATDNEQIEQALKVIARGGTRKVEMRARIQDYKDQKRDERRKARLLEKGY